MSTEGKTFDITTILFESNDISVLVKGTINQGHMNYTSDITVSMSQLNQLLNQLRRQNEEFELELPENEDYDTIGGFVFSHLGYIPKSGESFDYENLRFSITVAGPRNVNRIRIEKRHDNKTPEQ